MKGKIFVVQGDGSLQSLSETDFATEDDFQTLLEKYPDLIPGEQIDSVSPRRWLLVSREYGVPDEENATDRWSLDHLFLDQDGVPTLVEVKRRSDARLTNSRREVVGQMLDYAANAVVYWPVDKMRVRYEAACEARGENAEQKLLSFLQTDDTNEITMFWQKVEVNLQASRLRLLFVADFIPSELRRIVEFLNANMNSVEVLAVEIKHFVGTDANGATLKTLVPRVFGQTAQTEQKKAISSTRSKVQWSAEEFFVVLNSKNNVAAKVARQLHDWAEMHQMPFVWGSGAEGSFSPRIVDEKGQHRIFTVYGSGSIEFLFEYMRREPPFDDSLLEMWRALLNELPDVQIGDAPKRPNIKLEMFAEPQNLQQLLVALNWALEQIRKP